MGERRGTDCYLGGKGHACRQGLTPKIGFRTLGPGALADAGSSAPQRPVPEFAGSARGRAVLSLMGASGFHQRLYGNVRTRKLCARDLLNVQTEQHTNPACKSRLALLSYKWAPRQNAIAGATPPILSISP